MFTNIIGISDIMFGLTLTEQSKSKNDQLKGLTLVEETLDNCFKVFGLAYILMLGVALLKAYYTVGLYDLGFQVFLYILNLMT